MQRNKILKKVIKARDSRDQPLQRTSIFEVSMPGLKEWVQRSVANVFRPQPDINEFPSCINQAFTVKDKQFVLAKNLNHSATNYYE